METAHCKLCISAAGNPTGFLMKSITQVTRNITSTHHCSLPKFIIVNFALKNRVSMLISLMRFLSGLDSEHGIFHICMT